MSLSRSNAMLQCNQLYEDAVSAVVQGSVQLSNPENSNV